MQRGTKISAPNSAVGCFLKQSNILASKVVYSKKYSSVDFSPAEAYLSGILTIVFYILRPPEKSHFLSRHSASLIFSKTIHFQSWLITKVKLTKVR